MPATWVEGIAGERAGGPRDGFGVVAADHMDVRDSTKRKVRVACQLIATNGRQDSLGCGVRNIIFQGKKPLTVGNLVEIVEKALPSSRIELQFG